MERNTYCVRCERES